MISPHTPIHTRTRTHTHKVCSKDVLVGIAASGTTPYVLGAVRSANEASEGGRVNGRVRGGV